MFSFYMIISTFNELPQISSFLFIIFVLNCLHKFVFFYNNKICNNKIAIINLLINITQNINFFIEKKYATYDFII